MPISIPVKAYIVTLNGNDPQWKDSTVRSAFDGVNRIWAGSGLTFTVRSVDAFSDTAIGGTGNGDMNDETFFYLASKYPGRDCPAAYFIHKFAGTEGGTSTTINDTNWVLAAEYSGNQASSSRILAHELGHLVNLGHVDDGFTIGPNHPLPSWMRNNLMYSAISLDTKLSDTQINTAKKSALARRFGG